METGHLSRDLPPTDPEQIELQRQVDALLFENDREVARLLSAELERLREK